MRAIRWRGCVLLTALIVVMSGCDDTEEVSCDDVERACEIEGAVRCTVGTDGVEACGENSDGCLEWTVTQTCAPNQWCDISAEEPRCICDDMCETEGTSSCIGNSIVACTPDANGCLDLVDTEDCGAQGLVCDESTTPPQCVVDCSNECSTAGQTSCDGHTIMTCTADEQGCLSLETTRDCSSEGLLCDESPEGADCVECDNLCESEGATSCEGDTIMTCTADIDGCLSFDTTTDCADLGYICDDSGGAAECIGCGSCDAAGEYCDDSVEPPECLMAGTIAEILEGIDPETAWSELDAVTQAAVEARAQYTFLTYREAYGPDALSSAIDRMLTESTAEMEANYTTFLSVTFGVDAVTHLDVDAVLRQLYVLSYFAWQATAVSYHGMPATGWDGASAVTFMPLPDADTLDAFEELGDDLTSDCDTLRDDVDLSEEEAAIVEHAMALARQFRTGSFGYHFGGDALKTVHGLTGWAFDFLLNYSEAAYGNIFESDDTFLDQFNAYLFADLIRVWEGAAVTLDFQFSGFADPGNIAMFIGDPAENRTAQLYLLLSEFFYDRVMEHPDIDEPCLIYLGRDQRRIWDAFTADSFDDNDGETDFETFHIEFLEYADTEIEVFKSIMAEALIELFPSDSSAMSVAERDAIIAAIDDVETLGEVRSTFDDGLGAAGDGTALDVLAAAIAALTIIGGRDYADPDNGDSWFAEDEAIAQSMWDEVRDWVLAEYGFPAEALPEDLVVDTDSWVMPGEWGLSFGIGESRSLTDTYRVMIQAANELVSLHFGLYLIGPAFYGLSLNTAGEVLDRFLDATLSGADAASLPLYRLDGLDRQAYLLGGNDATIRRFNAESCDPAGVVEWIGTTVSDEWGVPEDMRVVMTSLSLLGPWFIDYDLIAFRAIIDTLQDRLDMDHGVGTYRVDPFTLQACNIWNPKSDEGTYAALEACLVP